MSKEFRKYQDNTGHEVAAEKIQKIDLANYGGAMLHLGNGETVVVDNAYVHRFDPVIGGYIVKLEEGFGYMSDETFSANHITVGDNEQGVRDDVEGVQAPVPNVAVDGETAEQDPATTDTTEVPAEPTAEEPIQGDAAETEAGLVTEPAQERRSSRRA
jgi:hypothetical protein